MSPESGAVVENPLVKPPADNPFGGDFPGPRSRGSRALDAHDLYVMFEDAKSFIRDEAARGNAAARTWMETSGRRHGDLVEQRRRLNRHE